MTVPNKFFKLVEYFDYNLDSLKIVLCIFLLIISPNYVSAKCVIHLKNGGTLEGDSCRKEGNKVTLFKGGLTAAIDKNLVKEIITSEDKKPIQLSTSSAKKTLRKIPKRTVTSKSKDKKSRISKKREAEAKARQARKKDREAAKNKVIQAWEKMYGKLKGKFESDYLANTSRKGSIVTLVDGSSWEIEEIYRLWTELWLPGIELKVNKIDGIMVDLSTGLWIKAKRIK